MLFRLLAFVGDVDVGVLRGGVLDGASVARFLNRLGRLVPLAARRRVRGRVGDGGGRDRARAVAARERQRGGRGRSASLARLDARRDRERVLRSDRGHGVFRGRGARLAFPRLGLGRAVVVRAGARERRRVGVERLRDVRGGRGRGAGANAAAFAASLALPRGTLRRVSVGVERGGTLDVRVRLARLGDVARRGGRVGPDRAARRAHRSCRRRDRTARGACRRRGRRVARARATPDRVPLERLGRGVQKAIPISRRGDERNFRT